MIDNITMNNNILFQDLDEFQVKKRNRKIQWKDEIGEKLEIVHEFESKHEPYFKVFMTYKELIKTYENLKNLEILLNKENKENINHRLQHIYDHIMARKIYNKLFTTWVDLSMKYPEIATILLEDNEI